LHQCQKKNDTQMENVEIIFFLRSENRAMKVTPRDAI